MERFFPKFILGNIGIIALICLFNVLMPAEINAQKTDPSSQQRLVFPDFHTKAYYEKINLKITKLEEELELEKQRIKAKKYPPETEKKELSTLTTASSQKAKPFSPRDRMIHTVNWGAIICVAFALLFLFFCFVAVVASFLKWEKSGSLAKFAMGCAVLGAFFGSLFCSILFCILLFTCSSNTAPPLQPLETSVDDYLAQNAAEFHDLGANLFAEAVVENNREKLFTAIEYLEKACAGNPDNKAITVDLADAYMEVDSPSLTTMAIVLYESVFDSFDNDPLLARITAGYQQLGNYEAAFALSEKRLECCPDNMRLTAAIQMGFIAMSSGKMDQAKVAILANIQKRGDNPSLRLVTVTLMQAKGDKTGALAELDRILANNKQAPGIQAYAMKVKESITNE